MSENKLKSSLLEKYSLKSSILTASSLGASLPLKSSLSTMSTVKAHESLQKNNLSDSSLLVYGKKKSSVEENTAPVTTTNLAVKKSKLLTNESNLVNTGLLFKPSILSSSTKSSPLNYSSFSSMAHSSSSYSNSTLFQHSEFTSNLLTPKIANLSTKIEQVQIETNIPAKRPYFHLDSSESESLLLKEEYIKTNALIEAINLEQKKYDEELARVKKFKRDTKPLSFLENSMFLKNELTLLQRQKNILINTVSGSLLRQPNFKNPNDPTRLTLLKCAEAIVKTDPEFIMKLALYTRQELNIRVTANFLICLASFEEVCRPYLQKYFKSSIQLPSDWIDVAEQYVNTFMDKKINFGALPSALRKVMCEKFNDFDQYQLAKYNKEKSRSGKNKNLKDVKHVKSKLKDADGSENMGESAIVEDKFILTLNKGGLKINDRIYFELVIPEKCQNVKFDILQQDEIKSTTEFKPSKTRRGVPLKPPKEEKPNENCAVRINLDYTNRRITQRSFINKIWSKRSDTVNSPPNFEFVKTFEPLKFFINVNANEFVFGHINNSDMDSILSKYSHSRHSVDLFKLNTIRISGASIKLKDLKIRSKDSVQFDTQESEENEKVLKQRSFTLKQLIRQLHISQPVDSVMSLIGKKYPSTYEEFMLSKLPGAFDSEKCGKRMKLPTPETWETQISIYGNRAEIWERLIDNKKLPYMAMLRNLRNMIKSGISERHHQWVIKKLQDEGAVVHSRQFPFRFFTAYEVLDELEEEYTKYIAWSTTVGTQVVAPPRYRGSKKTKGNEPKQITDMYYDPDILKRYKTALDNALKVATTFNISPIKGSTAIFLNLSRAMNFFVAGSTKSLGKKVTTISDIAALLALMFKYSCEHSKLVIFSDNQIYTDIELEQGTILDNMKSLTELKNLKPSESSSSHSALYPYRSFQDMLTVKENYDNIIYLSNGVGDIEFHQKFLRNYRALVNEDLLFVNVNLSVAECGLMNDFNFDHENDVSISGYSDSILRFVAERGNQGQLIHVENIDKSYDLPALKNFSRKTTTTASLINASTKSAIERPKFKIYVPKPEWKMIKVFISSTFLDMHAERDVLTRTVFPMLRSKLSPYLININEIDLRWGITESEAKKNETLEICLNQILESEYFVSMLGERYGHVLNDYTCIYSQSQKLNWLDSYPQGASITELEIECQLNKTDVVNKYEKSFFYFRDPEFLKNVPEQARNYFVDENDEMRQKLAKLKSKILAKPYEVYNGYKCTWFKLEENTNRALVTDLDVFAHRVFNNLFNAIFNHSKDIVQQSVELNESVHQSNLNEAYSDLYAESFVGRDKLLTKFQKLLIDNQFVDILSSTTDASKDLIEKKNSIINIFLLSGENGAGKTSFLCYFLKNYPIVKHRFVHYVGAYENSEYVLMFLKRFCVRVCLDYNLGNDFNEQEMNESNDLNFFKATFAKILKKVSDLIKNDKFYIILDGADTLLDENKNFDFSFNWIPEFIPPRISFIFSARSSNTQIKSALSKMSSNSRIKLETFEITQLDVLDKSEFIRFQLSKFNKRLDETPFNNQIKLLTTKRDSVSPLYLSWICDELRQFNHYETLSQKIKELPIKMNLLVDYILKRLETTFDAKFTQVALMFIACARNGLTEHDFKKLIKMFYNIEKLNYLDIVEKCESLEDLKNYGILSKILEDNLNTESSTLKVCSFIESISHTFLKPRSNDLLCLVSDSLVVNCLKTKYGAKSSRPNSMLINKLMALYYWHLLDIDFVKNWSLNANQQAYILLPWHLSMSGSSNDINLILSDLTFLAAKCKLGLTFEIMDDFDMHQTYYSKNIFTSTKSNKPLMPSSRKYLDYKLFISTNAHLLQKNPELIYQQAMNQPESSHVASDLIKLLESSNTKTGLLFEWINKSRDSDKFNLFPVKIKDVNDAAVCSVSISPNGQKIACGTENCEIRLYSMATTNLIKILQGHSGRINQTCFVDDETLCSASSDGIASIWNASEGYRIKVLDKHNGHAVSSCCGEPNGKSFISVGWDSSAKIWSKLGELQGELKGHPRPINCVVFKPEGDLVATGCWDSCIRIFNLFDRSRKAILRGHTASVRALAFSFNGVYIASSSIDSEVKLWNSKNGSQIATLKSHSMPVNTVRFSPNSPFLFTASTDCTTKCWSGSVGKMVNVIRNDHENEAKIASVCFDQRNGETIAVGYHSGELVIYNLLGSGSLKAKLKVHNSQIKRIKFSNFCNYLVTGSDDGSVKIIEVSASFESLKVVSELKGSTKSINALAINKYNTLITGSEDCTILVYTSLFENIRSSSRHEENFDIFCDDTPIETDIPEKTEVSRPKFVLDAHKSPITACSFNQSGDKFASSSKNGQIIIWSINQLLTNVTELISIPNAHSDWITDLQWSNSSDFILTSSNDFTLKIWNSVDGKQRQHLTGHTSNIKSCSFQYGCAISCAYDGSVKVWSHKGHEITTLIGHQGVVNGCDVWVKLKSKSKLNKETLKTTDGDDEKMELGDLWSEKVEEETWINKHKSNALNKLDYEVEKFYLVTVSDDNTIRLWKPMESDYLISLENHSAKINSIDLDKNGILATGSNDKSINLWNMNDYFKNYTSGMHVNKAERLTRSHNSEITCICPTLSGAYVLTSSRDGILIVWKCIYNSKSRLKEVKFILEIQAHDRPCNRICILEENQTSFKFATSSDKAPIKIWNFKEEIPIEKSSIELIQSLKTSVNDYVFFIGVVEKLKQKFLISVESSLFRIYVRFYKVVKNVYVIQPTSGCSIINSGYSIMINKVKISNDILFMTLPTDEIIRIDLNDMLKRFQTYIYSALILTSQIDNATLDLSLQGSKKNWFSSVDEFDLVTMAGDVHGNLYTNEKTPSKLTKSKSIHKSRITELICLNNERIVSASQDGTIKIWTKNADIQLGQYNSNSGVSVLAIIPGGKDNYQQVNFMFGDQMGALNLLRWYDE